MTDIKIQIDQDKLARLIYEQSTEINHWCCKSEVSIGVINGAVITICAYSRDEAIEDGFEGVESEFNCLGLMDYP